MSDKPPNNPKWITLIDSPISEKYIYLDIPRKDLETDYLKKSVGDKTFGKLETKPITDFLAPRVQPRVRKLVGSDNLEVCTTSITNLEPLQVLPNSQRKKPERVRLHFGAPKGYQDSFDLNAEQERELAAGFGGGIFMTIAPYLQHELMVVYQNRKVVGLDVSSEITPKQR